jgi:hypothetical protein
MQRHFAAVKLLHDKNKRTHDVSLSGTCMDFPKDPQALNRLFGKLQIHFSGVRIFSSNVPMELAMLPPDQADALKDRFTLVHFSGATPEQKENLINEKLTHIINEASEEKRNSILSALGADRKSLQARKEEKTIRHGDFSSILVRENPHNETDSRNRILLYLKKEMKDFSINSFILQDRNDSDNYTLIPKNTSGKKFPSYPCPRTLRLSANSSVRISKDGNHNKGINEVLTTLGFSGAQLSESLTEDGFDVRPLTESGEFRDKDVFHLSRKSNAFTIFDDAYREKLPSNVKSMDKMLENMLSERIAESKPGFFSMMEFIVAKAKNDPSLPKDIDGYVLSKKSARESENNDNYYEVIPINKNGDRLDQYHVEITPNDPQNIRNIAAVQTAQPINFSESLIVRHILDNVDNAPGFRTLVEICDFLCAQLTSKEIKDLKIEIDNNFTPQARNIYEIAIEPPDASSGAGEVSRKEIRNKAAAKDTSRLFLEIPPSAVSVHSSPKALFETVAGDLSSSGPATVSVQSSATRFAKRRTPSPSIERLPETPSPHGEIRVHLLPATGSVGDYADSGAKTTAPPQPSNVQSSLRALSDTVGNGRKIRVHPPSATESVEDHEDLLANAMVPPQPSQSVESSSEALFDTVRSGLSVANVRPSGHTGHAQKSMLTRLTPPPHMEGAGNPPSGAAGISMQKSRRRLQLKPKPSMVPRPEVALINTSSDVPSPTALRGYSNSR